MSRLSKERGEHEALKLDETYKETLDRVTPYILALKIPEDGHLCRKWLQKLSRASSQRSLRNQYLLELCCHLKSGRIGGIFCKPPQSGPLEPLPRLRDRTINASSSMSELSDTSFSAPQEIASRPMTRHRNKSFSGNRSSDSSSTNCDYEISPAARYCDKIRPERNQNSAYKRRIESLTALVRDLQAQRECLKRSLSYSRENCDCGEKTNSLGATIEQLTLEITTLRARLVEVNAMKDELEKNHCEIVDQYKNAMAREFNDLNARLEEARSRNEELDARVETISAQLDKIIFEKNEESSVLEKNFNETMETARVQRAKELAERDSELALRDAIIREKDAELATRENCHRDRIASLNEKIRALEDKLETKIEDEGRLQSFLKEQCSTMKEEFAKMRNDMEVSARTENQSLVEKISALKKIIMKLVKSKEKQSVDFENRISHVLKVQPTFHPRPSYESLTPEKKNVSYESSTDERFGDKEFGATATGTSERARGESLLRQTVRARRSRETSRGTIQGNLSSDRRQRRQSTTKFPQENNVSRESSVVHEEQSGGRRSIRLKHLSLWHLFCSM